MPEGMEPEFFRSLLRLSRLVQRKDLPLTDTHSDSSLTCKKRGKMISAVC